MSAKVQFCPARLRRWQKEARVHGLRPVKCELGDRAISHRAPCVRSHGIANECVRSIASSGDVDLAGSVFRTADDSR